MNELTKALRFADTAIKTVRVIDVIKKAVIFFGAPQPTSAQISSALIAFICLEVRFSG